MTRICGDLSKLEECKVHFGDKGMVDWIYESLKIFPQDAELMLNASYACRN